MKDKFVKFILAREKMRAHKNVIGGPGPHSPDPILAAHHFCNVDREDDAVTRWIHSNVRKKYCATHDKNFMVQQLMLCRVFNEPTSLKVILPVDNVAVAVDKLRKYHAAGNKIMRGAYMVAVHGPKGRGKNVVEHYLTEVLPMVGQKNFAPMKTLQEVAEALMSVPSLGDFLANQICADLRYVPFWGSTYEDWETFVLAGPGTKKGVNRYRGLKPKSYLKQEWYGEQLMLIRKEIHPDLTAPIRSMLRDPNNLSNCFCEFDKYCRAEEQIAAGETVTLRHYHGNQNT